MSKKDRTERVAYLADMTAELAKIAAEENLSTAAYLLKVAHLELEGARKPALQRMPARRGKK